MRVIVVDDENHVLMRMERLISQIPEIVSIKCFKNPSEALEYIHDNTVDVAFIDIEMPEMDGLALSSLIMEQCPNLEVIFVTAHDEYALKAYQTNAIGYLLKPVLLEDIKKQVERIIRYRKPPVSNIKSLYFNVFGRFFISSDENKKDIISFRTEKSEELLAFLLIQQGKPVSRDMICEKLWPDMDIDRATRNFHTTAYNIRHSLNELGISDMLIRTHNSYSLKQSYLSSDLDLFNTAAVQFSKGNATISVIEKAVSIYSGIYMGDKDYIWSYETQNYYEQVFENMSLFLSDEYIKNRDYNRASNILHKLLDNNPIQEEACEKLMSLNIAYGSKTEALKIYKIYEKKLFDELGEKPSQKLFRMVKGLL
jgi:two-component SAPR family response regulator